MLYHSIYSVRDKKKVNAEVIDIREIEGAKGVRFQIVGRHPEDGTTVTTFCSAAVAEDYKEKMSTLPHGLSAESIEVAQDHIPTSEATVISTDGTPVDDDLKTFVEDPLVGSPSEGTLTSAKVMAAEGELSKTSCCCGATEDKPCACMTSDEPMQCSSTEPKCACYAAKGAEGVSNITLEDLPKDSLLNIIESVSNWLLTAVDDPDVLEEYDDVETFIVGDFVQDFVDAANKNVSQAETVAGIDVQTPSQIAIETPDSDQLIVPDPDHLVSGDGHVIGQQTGKVNTTPMHAEGDIPETMSPNQALEYLKSGDNCVWLVGYSAGERDYPIEESEELATLIEEGVFEEDSTLVIATKLHKPWSGDAYNPSEDEDFGFGRNDAESYSPGFARNPKVLVPTAVIGGLALAYLAKPELLSSSFDKISSMLSSLTNKGDKTE